MGGPVWVWSQGVAGLAGVRLRARLGVGGGGSLSMCAAAQITRTLADLSHSRFRAQPLWRATNSSTVPAINAGISSGMR